MNTRRMIEDLGIDPDACSPVTNSDRDELDRRGVALLGVRYVVRSRYETLIGWISDPDEDESYDGWAFTPSYEQVNLSCSFLQGIRSVENFGKRDSRRLLPDGKYTDGTQIQSEQDYDRSIIGEDE